jgi:hypothetical protein
VAALVERARKALAIGLAELAKDELPCGCFYADGSPRFVTPDRKPVHRCGR